LNWQGDCKRPARVFLEDVMPELYIGNVTKQIQMFAYRVPERQGVITQTIPIGGQIRVSPNGYTVDLTTPEIDAILTQHKAYGILAVEELDSKGGPFSGLVYSIGKQLTADKLFKGMKRREEEINKFGQRIRQEAALAVNSQIEQQIGRPLRELDMSFEEEEPRGGYNDDLDHLAEGVKVTRKPAEGIPFIDRRGRRA
jgi:hypothetical protein